MFVVRKLDRELPFVFWFRSLAGAIRLTENETNLLAGGGAQMADDTNGGAGAGQRLSREKLLSMTTDTGIMVWKVGNVGKVALRRPWRGNFVAGVARQTLVFVG